MFLKYSTVHKSLLTRHKFVLKVKRNYKFFALLKIITSIIIVFFYATWNKCVANAAQFEVSFTTKKGIETSILINIASDLSESKSRRRLKTTKLSDFSLDNSSIRARNVYKSTEKMIGHNQKQRNRVILRKRSINQFETMKHRQRLSVETCTNHPKKKAELHRISTLKTDPSQCSCAVARWEIQLSEITFKLTLHKVSIIAEIVELVVN